MTCISTRATAQLQLLSIRECMCQYACCSTVLEHMTQSSKNILQPNLIRDQALHSLLITAVIAESSCNSQADDVIVQ